MLSVFAYLCTADGGTAKPPTVALCVPARSDEVAGIRRAVGSFGRGAGLDEERMGGVVLAVGEACANAVVHAYRDCDPGVLRVTADVTSRGLEVTVSDDGTGMAARHDSPGLGLGLPLMSSLATAIEIRASAQGGTEIWMVFAASGPAACESWAQTG